jgi:hypothetical protein
MLMMIAISTAITVTRPTTPGWTKARPISQMARSVPTVRQGGNPS